MVEERFEILKSIRYKIQHIISIKKYLNYIDNEVTDNTESEKPDSNQRIWDVTIYDVLTNKDMNKLVKSLYKLNDKEYTKRIGLRKKKSKNLHYLRLEINHTGSGVLAYIEFKNHDYFKKISLSYTQVTNQTIAIEYKISFKKAILFTEIRNFIRNNIKSTYFTGFTSIFDNESLKEKNGDFIHQREMQYIRDIFQSFIVKKLFSNYGKKYQLPIGYTINYEKNVEFENELKNPFLMLSLYNKPEDYYILIDELNNSPIYYLYFSGNTIPKFPFLTNFQYLGNEFYYNMFNHIENMELTTKVTRYLLGNYKIVKKKDYLWLVNKLRALKDSDFKPNNYNESIKKDDWEIRYDEEPSEDNFFTGNNLTLKYTRIYNEYHDYMKTLLTTQNDTIVLVVGSLTLIFTILGILVTLILS
ncbi:hypothetical protein MHB48_15160 [Psychrobacillus sp. FSL H8-0483]|uniref:hypothetical protein n=1 Tax=Psychrobacillus sp. FSL H8-0483 TaxID=2921389 RepID=UPI003159ED52